MDKSVTSAVEFLFESIDTVTEGTKPYGTVLSTLLIFLTFVPFLAISILFSLVAIPYFMYRDSKKTAKGKIEEVEAVTRLTYEMTV